MSEANRSVLLVDDDPAILRIVSHWIEHAGYEVRTASNGSEALFQIDAKCPNFLITDWDMPVMDGVALCGALSERRLPHYVYTLFLTARSDSEDMIKAIELGADDFVVKPIGRGEILARLRAGARVLEMESRLRLLANTDPLTGLSCKRSFREQVRREWNVCKVPANAVSCVILDIDFFKKVNDTHGHPAGDEALRSIGKLIAANCRANDVVCRYGGDEFSAMLPGANENEAAAWAERLRQTVAKTPIHIAGSTIQITASFGVAQRFDDSQSFDELTAAADQCLLLAKQLGRNRVVRFSDLKDHGETPQFDRRQIVDPFRGVLARDVMTPVVAGISLGSSLESLADYFLDFRINSAPVVDANGKLVGIVSEKDLMQEMQRPAGWAQSVDDVMKTNVVS
jgi:two-component system chemotaxis response regulator CheY